MVAGQRRIAPCRTRTVALELWNGQRTSSGAVARAHVPRAPSPSPFEMQRETTSHESSQLGPEQRGLHADSTLQWSAPPHSLRVRLSHAGLSPDPVVSVQSDSVAQTSSRSLQAETRHRLASPRRPASERYGRWRRGAPSGPTLGRSRRAPDQRGGAAFTSGCSDEMDTSGRLSRPETPCPFDVLPSDPSWLLPVRCSLRVRRREKPWHPRYRPSPPNRRRRPNRCRASRHSPPVQASSPRSPTSRTTIPICRSKPHRGPPRGSPPDERPDAGQPWPSISGEPRAAPRPGAEG
jgi:hypothetical protein